MEDPAQIKKKKDFTKMRTPHTYVIIFCVVILAWLLTFLVPAGKFSTEDVTYKNEAGEVSTRTVLKQDSFRYSYKMNKSFVFDQLEELEKKPEELKKLNVPKEQLTELIQSGEKDLTQEALDKISLTDDVLYQEYGDKIYDTSKKLHKTAKFWGTEDFNGFGFMNFVFEGLVSGDKYGSAVGIAALILVVGGAFGIIMSTGAIEAGIFAFISKVKGLERLAIPLVFITFSFGGATFGMAEEVIPFSMVMVPFVIALGYDSIVAVTVTYVASQIGNAASWMNPFSVAVAQGIAGVPVLSGATFRLIMWIVITLAAAGYTLIYAERIRKNPTSSLSYKTDAKFRDRLSQTFDEHPEFKLGHKLILIEMAIVLVWIIWGVTQKGYYIPEIASQFFVMGLFAGIIAVIFKLNNMTVNDIASSFQSGASELAGTAIVVGMAKGILLVLGGSDANVPSALNTVLHGMGTVLADVPTMLGAWAMYVFQSLFNLVITSNSGQAALTMPIMAPLADLIGVSRQIAVLAYQLGAGFVDAFTPVSASLIGVLGVAGIDWAKWAKFQIKMQGFLFILGTIFIIIAVAIGFN
ncbi:putative basic amino acid antiporter YfcC [Vagococcus penaei]|uniref:putative basic amino acid antiporter YfcC n=1 Tax=Vagococcus penaei TaxID=633807 RepID=UPI000F863774|nr:putative basic amino acid antiporter YfcC [Vagococcus penaei]